MAIQNRRGTYTNFDPTKMVAGEFAIVQEDDPNSSTGRALYICFEPGVVKRICDYEDVQDTIVDAASAYISDLSTAASAANAAAIAANTAAEAATRAAKATNEAFGQGYGVESSYSGNVCYVTLEDYEQVVGGTVAVRFISDVGSGASLCINGTTAAQIMHVSGISYSTIGGSEIKNGDIASFMYDGTNYWLLNVYRPPMSSGDALSGLSTISSTISPKILSDTIADRLNSNIEVISTYSGTNVAGTTISQDLSDCKLVMMNFVRCSPLIFTSSDIAASKSLRVSIEAAPVNMFMTASVSSTGIVFGDVKGYGTYGNWTETTYSASYSTAYSLVLIK